MRLPISFFSKLLLNSAVLMVFGGLWVQGQEVNRKGKSFPELKLPGWVPASMVEAVAAGRFSEIAAWYGYDDKSFRKMLKEDGRSLKADRKGYLHYVCPGLVASTGLPVGPAAVVTQPVYPLSQTFMLHSRPGATKVIYLDFNGHVTSGTTWNTSYNGGNNIVTPSYDLDGNALAFSDTELARIQGMWKRVAEDFMSYDVDVTTEDPGVDALMKSPSTDTAYGVRVCVGGNSNDWFKSAAGGIAYLGSYDWSSDTPCFVFSAQLGSGNEKYTAEAISHEVGHTLRLQHDGQMDAAGVTTVDYYEGHGNWAPIMGVGYYKEVTHWSKGEYAMANNLEDDTAVMLGEGITLRADEHGDTTANATVLSGTSVSATGIVSTRSDMDVFRFTTGAGPVSFSVTPAVPSANLDVQLALYDAAGSLVGQTNPTGMAGALTATLAEGTYFLAVDGAGTGDAATAYNDYGSMGEYALSGTVAPTVNQPPVVVASGTPTTGVAPLAVTFSSNGTYDSGGAIASYSWVFGDGTTSTAANPAKTYTTAGTYQARLTAQDSGGLTATATVTITVTAPTAPPVAPIAVAAGTPTTGTVPLAVAFSSAGSSDPDGTIASYNWVFGDGTTSTAANPAKTYTTAGTYQATLTVRDATGLTGTSVVTITARPANVAPVARAAANVTTGAAPLAVTFSSAGSSDADGTIASYNWVFGDGTTSTAANPVKTYSTAGTFLATLTVRDNAGAASAAASVTITVQQAASRIFVTNIAMAGKVSRGARSATATVTVKNSRGALVSGAVVSGTWSGAVSRSVTATTSSKGTAVLSSPTSTVAGTFTFTVTGITLNGWVYDPKSNVETTDFVRVQ